MARKRTWRFPVRQSLDLGWLAIAIGFLIGEDGWGFRAKATTDDQASAGDSLATVSLGIEAPTGSPNAAGSLHGSGDGAVFAEWDIAEANDTDPDSFDWSAIRQDVTMPGASPSVLPDWLGADAGATRASVDPLIFEMPAWVFDSSAMTVGDISVPIGLPVAEFVDPGFAIL